ncbi:MAG: hypothetical protein FJ100_00235 [Deltaproteobacteria bacterium]|nr:hypothetical protein [Deltaproteobacteria bacterium]
MTARVPACEVAGDVDAVAAALRWIGWIVDPRSRDAATGHWWSWVGEGGYPYAEATAWVLLALAEARAAGIAHGSALAEIGDAACEGLARGARQGGLGRGGRWYAFDTAVGLAAVHAWRPEHPAVNALWLQLRTMAAERRAVQGGPRLGQPAPGARWSEVWGAHLLWLAVAAHSLGEVAWARSLAKDLLDPAALVPMPTYCHALAYACEGLVALRGEAVFDTQLGAWWTRLRRAATPGGVVAHAGEKGPVRADTTAQTARLLRTLEPQADAAPWLRLLWDWTDAQGAVHYEPGSPHANAWCTAMALRAAVAALEDG